jgi:hypothetical protein
MIFYFLCKNNKRFIWTVQQQKPILNLFKFGLDKPVGFAGLKCYRWVAFFDTKWFGDH